MKIGLVGVTEVGKIMHTVLEKSAAIEYAGGWDSNASALEKFSKTNPSLYYKEYKELLKDVDVLIFSSVKADDFSYVQKAIRNLKHVYLENPYDLSTGQILSLEKLAREAGITVQVGMIERYNPAFLLIAKQVQTPALIEARRFLQWNAERKPFSLIRRLMLHDLDLIMSVVPYGIKRIQSHATKVIGGRPDVAHARIEFHNGTIASLAAGSVAVRNESRIQFYHPGGFFAVNLHEKHVDFFDHSTVSERPGVGANQLKLDLKLEHMGANSRLSRHIPQSSALESAFSAFFDAIEENRPPDVTLESYRTSLEAALYIEEKINHLWEN